MHLAVYFSLLGPNVTSVYLITIVRLHIVEKSLTKEVNKATFAIQLFAKKVNVLLLLIHP